MRNFTIFVWLNTFGVMYPIVPLVPSMDTILAFFWHILANPNVKSSDPTTKIQTSNPEPCTPG